MKLNLFILLIIGFSFSLSGQEQASKDSTRAKLTKAAREIMTATSTCALISVDSNGVPRARTMSTFAPEEDFTVWFGTNPNSRKVNQIKKNPLVSLYYLDSDESGYVLLHGIAEIVNSQKEKNKWWKEEWEAFYPNKKKDYLLLKVPPKWLEVRSPTRNIGNDPVSWKPPVVLFGSE